MSRFVYGTRINVPEYLEKNGTTYRLVTDHLGSVRLVIDTTTDTVVQALTYDPWGVVVSVFSRKGPWFFKTIPP